MEILLRLRQSINIKSSHETPQTPKCSGNSTNIFPYVSCNNAHSGNLRNIKTHTDVLRFFPPKKVGVGMRGWKLGIEMLETNKKKDFASP